MRDLIERQDAIDALDCINGVEEVLRSLPSAQPEYYDYSDIDDVWEYYAKEQDIKLTDGAKQLKDAMWVGYRKGKQDAQPDIVRCKDCKNWDTTWQNDWAKNYHYCPLIGGTRNGDWYCADAERRST